MTLVTKQYELTGADGRMTQAWEASIEVETNGSPRHTLLVEFGHTRNDALDALAYACYKAAGALHDAAEAAIEAQEAE